MTEALVQPDGWVTLRDRRMRAALGAGGVRTHKQEGDQATPAGLLALRRVLYRADRLAVPLCAVPREPLSPQDGWCDDISDAAYNRQITLPHPARHEELWRSDALYDVIGVLGWNDDPVAPGRGSAIFLHLARPDYAPTDGCVALALDHLRKVLAMGLTEILVTV